MLAFSFDSIIRLPIPDWTQFIIAYVTYLFAFELLRLSSITNYLAGLQHTLATSDIPRTVWSAPLHQTMRGYARDEVSLFPERRQIKIPFTRAMIKTAHQRLLSTIYGPHSIVTLANHAALCMGLMFLFRKSEFLTGLDKKVKKTNNLTVTLLSKNCQLWYEDGSSYKASEGRSLPSQPPVYLSIYLEATKNDQFGKGAQRFFPSDPSNPDCMVNIVYQYIRVADLTDNDPLFCSPHITISDKMLSKLLKTTCVISGIKPELCSLHSLRVGGLVTLFAANVPDSLKQLAGRWKSPTSFVVYARATMAQFSQIAQALNNVSLVTAEHIKQFYQFPRL